MFHPQIKKQGWDTHSIWKAYTCACIGSKFKSRCFPAVKDGFIAIARWKEGLPTNSNSDANQDRGTHNSQNNAHEFYEIQHAAQRRQRHHIFRPRRYGIRLEMHQTPNQLRNRGSFQQKGKWVTADLNLLPHT